MNDMQIVLNAAIFAVANIIDRGSTAYSIKDKSGSWHQMEWSSIICKLCKLLKEYEEERDNG